MFHRAFTLSASDSVGNIPSYDGAEGRHKREVGPKSALLGGEDDCQRVHAAWDWNYGAIDKTQNDQARTAKMAYPVHEWMGWFGGLNEFVNQHLILRTTARLLPRSDTKLSSLALARPGNLSLGAFVKYRRLSAASLLKFLPPLESHCKGRPFAPSGFLFAAIAPQQKAW